MLTCDGPRLTQSTSVQLQEGLDRHSRFTSCADANDPTSTKDGTTPDAYNFIPGTRGSSSTGRRNNPEIRVRGSLA